MVKVKFEFKANQSVVLDWAGVFQKVALIKVRNKTFTVLWMQKLRSVQNQLAVAK